MRPAAAIGVVVALLVVATATCADAATVSRCLARKIVNVGASMTARSRCWAVHAVRPDDAKLARCLEAASRRFTGVGLESQGAFEAAEAHPPCVTVDDQDVLDEELAGFATSLGIVLASSGTASRCDAAKLQCIGRYMKALSRCHALAAVFGTLDAECLANAALRFSDGATGCMDEAESSGHVCRLRGDAATFEAATREFLEQVLCMLDPADREGCPAPVATPTATTGGPAMPTPTAVVPSVDGATPTPTPSRTRTATPIRTRTATRTRTPTPIRTPTPVPTSASDPAQICVDRINQYRATVGLPPYARWTTAESCANAQALADGLSQHPHSQFGRCGEFAQNECPSLGTTSPSQQIRTCLQLMWNEGPGTDLSHGHYINMTSTRYTKVACGFGILPNGTMWTTQDFR